MPKGKGKGKKKSKSASKKTPALSDEEKRLLLEDQAAQMEIERKKRSRMAVKFLREKLEQEQQSSKANQQKIDARWRALLRQAKSDELKRDIEILRQVFERVLDRKEHIIQELLKDIHECERQEHMASRSHMRNMDRLIEFHSQTLDELQESFQEEISEMSTEFQVEREQLLEHHRAELDKLKDIRYSLEMKYQDKLKKSQEAFESSRSNIRSTSLDERTTLKADLQTRIKELWQEYQTEVKHFQATTAEKRAEYERLKSKDDQASAVIEAQMQRLSHLQQQISNFKQRLQSAKQEANMKHGELKQQKESVQAQVHQLKAQLESMRTRGKAALTKLAVKTEECESKLETYLKDAEKVLKEAEMCRKLETEEEKILPFYPDTQVEEPDAIQEVEEAPDDVPEPFESQASIYDPDNRRIDTDEAMTHFWKRYNKVLLDKMSLDRERMQLEEENEELKRILQQYLEGLSVSEDVLNKDNTLLVVNDRTNAPMNVPVGDGRVRQNGPVIIEATQAFRNTTRS